MPMKKSGTDTPRTGQADDLKVETTVDGERARVWLCRCGVVDGMLWERSVSLELCRGGQWETVLYWNGDDLYEYELV